MSDDPVAENFRQHALWNAFVAPAIEENTEAEINLATVDYTTMTTDALGRSIVRSKA